MIENKMPQTWFDTDYATTKALIDSKLPLDISAEAQAMLNAYTALGTTLTGDEETNMINYVNAEVASGNHAKKDFDIIMSLAGNNSLVDYIGSTVVTNNGATFGINGASFTGTNFINTLFNPSVDGVNYLVNSGGVSGYIKTEPGGTVKMVFGASSAAPSVSRIQLYNQSGSAINYSANMSADSGGGTQLISNEVVSLWAEDATTSKIFKDGVQAASTAVNRATQVPQVVAYLGCRNNDGTDGNHWDGTLSTFCVYGGAFNQPGHNTNLRALLTALGTI